MTFVLLSILLLMGYRSFAQTAPVITSFSPASAKPGDEVILTGTGFNTTAASNIVFFGATRATVTAATATSLTVQVPVGATYAPITLLNTGTVLACASLSNFNPTYSPAKAGIVSADFENKIDFSTGSAPNSVAIGDLDGDGKSDLAVANFGSSTVSVLRNTSTSGSLTSGSFAAKVNYWVGSYPYGIAIGDLDCDGKLDLVVPKSCRCEGGYSVAVLRNTSSSGSINSGSFSSSVDFTADYYPYSAAIGDLDGDGKPDLATANNTNETFSVLRNTSSSGSIGSGSFAGRLNFNAGSTMRPYDIAIGDLDGDGKADLAVANNGGNSVSVFKNTSTSGSIGFEFGVRVTAGSSPISVAIGDLNGDSKADLAVAHFGSSYVSVLRNTSTIGSFSFATKVDFTTGTTPASVAIGDLDGDGKADLAVGNYSSNTVSVLRNTSSSGSIGFAGKVDFTTGSSPYSVAIGDLDGDGKSELAVANYMSDNVSVLRNADPPCNNPTSAGTIAAAQSGTSPFDPATFTSSAAASGHTGTLEYKWQSSTTNSSTGFNDIASSNSDTYDAGFLTQTTWFKRLARVDCKSDWTNAAASNVLQVTVSKNWVGGDGNWSTAANWSDGVAPVASDALTISSGHPKLDVDFTVGGSLTLSGTGSLTINAGKTLAVSGTADFGGRSVTFKSNATGTSRLGIVSGSLTNADNVTVERYLPSGRKWRMLTAPLKGSTNKSIFYNWQNNDLVIAGTGVEIWGPDGYADPSNTNTGLATGPGASMRSYESTGWQNVTNTNTTVLFDNSTNYGYALFATSPYNNGSSNINPSQTPENITLSATGTLITGDHTKSFTAARSGQFFLVGNPYASAVDPRSFTTSGPENRTNLYGKFWMWDSKPGAGKGNGLGRYVSFDMSINEYNNLGDGYQGHDVMIQSGQAFFVQAIAPGTSTLVFRESSKHANSSHTMMGNIIETPPKALLRLTLRQSVTPDSLENLDGAVAVFHEEGRPGLDPLDGSKLMNTSENLFFRQAGMSLTFEHRPVPAPKDTLYLRLSNMQQKGYLLQAEAANFIGVDSLSLLLTDRYTGNSFPLATKGITRYPFSVTTDSISTGDRFMVVFSKAAAPVVVTPDVPVGVNVLRLYPNPVHDRIRVGINFIETEPCTIQVFDASGIEVWRQSGIGYGIKTVEINTSGFSSGVYNLVMTQANGIKFTEKFVKE
jgi:hypothetical protein